ncbi:MAG: peptidoglycan DD-metalloendopeptidase family protein [Acidimicrobiia bacterium]|nr:peptidoglycan DD-metalloendopeptidase family protein [Acidimicrobiia bacterium]
MIAVVLTLVAGPPGLPAAGQDPTTVPPPPPTPPVSEPTTTTSIPVEPIDPPPTSAPPTTSTTSTTEPPGEGPDEGEEPGDDPVLEVPPDAEPPPLPPVPPGLTPDRAAILEELRSDFEGATADELEFFGRLLAAQTLAENLAGEIELLDGDLMTLARQLDEAQRRLDEVEARLAATRERLAELDRQLDESNELLRRRAVDVYVTGGAGRSSAIAFLRSADANEADLVLTYSAVILGDQQDVIDRYRRLRDDAEEERRREQAEVAEARAARDDVDVRRLELQERRDAQERARGLVLMSATENEGLLAEASQRRTEFERRIAAVAAVSDGIAGTLRALQEGQRPPPISTGIFQSPLANMRITSPFGPRVHPIYGIARMHNGVDLAGSMGTPILAAGDGVVVFAENQGGYGLTVVIDHGNTLGTLYAHMSSFAVRPGDIVSAGDVLGGVGSTGLSTGPHLHFEVRILGQPVNPMPYLGG